MKKLDIVRLVADKDMYLTDGNSFYKSVDLTENMSQSDFTEIDELTCKRQIAQMPTPMFVQGLLSRNISEEDVEAFISEQEENWPEENIERKSSLMKDVAEHFNLSEQDIDGIFGLNENDNSK